MTGRPKKYLNVPEVAALFDVAEQVIYNALEQRIIKKIVSGANKGKINKELAEYAWSERAFTKRPQVINPNKPKAPTKKSGKTAMTPGEDLKEVHQTLTEAGIDPDAISGKQSNERIYVTARAANEVLKARKERIKVLEMEDKIVDKRRAYDLFYKLAKHNRDGWLNWPKVVSVELAEELGADPKAVHDLLSKLVKEQLDTVATLDLTLEELK